MSFRVATFTPAILVLATALLACSGSSEDRATEMVVTDTPSPVETTIPVATRPLATSTPGSSTGDEAPTARSTARPQTPDDAGTRVLIAPSPPQRPALNGVQVLTLAGSSLGPTTLDPALIRDAEGAFLARQIFRGLVRLDDTLAVQPDIATRIDISNDGLVYLFHLRNNAVFHDGSPIDADAIVASFNRASDPALAQGDGSALPAYLYFADIDGALERMDGRAGSISGIVAIDPLIVRITLLQPSTTFLAMLTGTCALIVDVETARAVDWWTEPNGSGPFVLEDLDSSLLTLSGFPGFYEGAPLLDEVRFLQGSARAQPLNLYESGRVDVVDVPFHSLDRVLSPTDALAPELHIEPQLSSTFLLMNPNQVPFDDRNVRLAIAHAIDREKLVQVGMESKVELAYGIVPPGILGREWGSDPLEYGIDIARSRHEQAGALDLNPTLYGSLAITFKGVLERDLGMQVDVIVPEWPLFAAKLTEGSLPAFVLSWIADYPDPSNFLQSMFHSRSPDNYIRYADPIVDRLLDDAAREQDDAARAALYLAAQQILIDDGVLVPLYHDVSYILVKPYVKGLNVTPVGLGSLDRVWIER